MRRHILSFGMTTVVIAAVIGVGAAGPSDFIPDATFTGSSLAGWRVVGPAEWKADNGELVGRVENLVTGASREFASGRELLESIASDLEANAEVRR